MAALEARPETPFLLRLEIWHHLRGCHSPQTFDVRSITPVVYVFVSFRAYGTIFRASLRKEFSAGPLAHPAKGNDTEDPRGISKITQTW